MACLLFCRWKYGAYNPARDLPGNTAANALRDGLAGFLVRCSIAGKGAGMCGGSVARYTILVTTICLPCADRRVVSVVRAALNINEPAR